MNVRDDDRVSAVALIVESDEDTAAKVDEGPAAGGDEPAGLHGALEMHDAPEGTIIDDEPGDDAPDAE